MFDIFEQVPRNGCGRGFVKFRFVRWDEAFRPADGVCGKGLQLRLGKEVLRDLIEASSQLEICFLQMKEQCDCRHKLIMHSPTPSSSF